MNADKFADGTMLGTVSDIYTPISFEQARHEMQGQIRYLDPSSVIATRQTKTPRCYSRSGYGNKLPTSWQVQLTDKRWRRVYVVCWSNSGSDYVCTKAGCLYLGMFEPSQFGK